MNWLAQLAEPARHEDELAEVLHALRKGGDNAEGIEIPPFVTRTFARLPTTAGGLAVPNYIAAFLGDAQLRERRTGPGPSAFDTFAGLWRAALAGEAERGAAPALSVLEPGCGSANDYRFLEAYGIARRIQYHGFDLCPANIANAWPLFPGVSFETGNAFAIAAPDRAFDLCFVHDLFEHFSPAGIEAAVGEVCRVTRRGLCVGFFNLDEIPDHQIRPLREYHWNRLSLARMRELFAARGFAGRAVNIGVFLRERYGCDQTHNPNAHTLFLRRSGSAGA
jgi:SAM-dependent methyltransferase